MSQVNFNDKQSGDQLTANDVNSLKSAINTNEGLLSNGTVSGYYDSNNQWRYNHHFIPATNSQYDLGSAEHKIRHLYLSDNSMWVGDEVKIDASPEGTIQTKKRDKSKLPYYITGVLDGSAELAYTFLNVDYAEEITLKGLEEYAQSLNPNVTLSDIFPPEGSANYQESDYESKSTLNNVSNKWTKIIIPDDENYEPITLDLEKSDHFHLVIPDSVHTNHWELYVNILGDPDSGYAEFKVLVSLQDIDQQSNLGIFTPVSPFKIRINNEDQNAFAEYKYWEYPANVMEQSGCTDIILYCSLVNATFSKGNDTFLLTDIYNPINGDFVAYNTIDGVEYGVIHEDFPPPASSPTWSYLSDDSILQMYYEEDMSGNVSFTIEHVGDAVFIDPANWTVTSFQEVSIDGVNKKIITEMSVKTPRQAGGTLYTDYIYLGNPNSQYGGDDTF